MSKTILILAGVDKYNDEKICDLQFCKNDINLIKEAFVSLLQKSEVEIIDFTNCGIVNLSQFMDVLKKAISTITLSDILIIYFSGHGNIDLDNTHFLQFSDFSIPTQDIIDDLNEIYCKGILFIIDSCYSGSFEQPYIEHDVILESFDELIEKGCAIFSSSNLYEKSRFTENGISIFTKYLCDALNSSLIIRNGEKSLHEIIKLTFLMMDIWNRKNPDMQQHPIYKKSIIGDILFKVESYEPYKEESFCFKCEEYAITEVVPVHHGLKKRYSAVCLLNKIKSWDEISKITLEIIDILKNCDIYKTLPSEIKLKQKKANVVWVYFAYDNQDILNNNYICHSLWIDKTMKKKDWYKERVSQFTINDVNITIHTQYDFVKQFINENPCDEQIYYASLKSIIHSMIIKAHEYISMFEQYKQDEISEPELVEKVQQTIKEIDKLYFKSTELPIAPDSFKEEDQKFQNLVASIHNLTYAYIKDTKYNTEKSRKSYFETYVKFFYRDLENIKRIKIPLD